MRTLDDIHLTAYLPVTEAEALLEARRRVDRAEAAIEQYIEACTATGASEADVLAKLKTESEAVEKQVEEQTPQARSAVGTAAAVVGAAAGVYHVVMDIYDRNKEKDEQKEDRKQEAQEDTQEYDGLGFPK